jgi:hypothetical protein
MPFDVFISHSHIDKLAADAACATLEAEGIRCWIAPRNLRSGASWASAIIEGIDECRIMVLIFSSNANQSGQVAREIERAIHKGLTIIPLRIERIEAVGDLEYFLAGVHWLDSVDPPTREDLHKLAIDIKAILETTLGRHREGASPADERSSPPIGQAPSSLASGPPVSGPAIAMPQPEPPPDTAIPTEPLQPGPPPTVTAIPKPDPQPEPPPAKTAIPKGMPHRENPKAPTMVVSAVVIFGLVPLFFSVAFAQGVVIIFSTIKKSDGTEVPLFSFVWWMGLFYFIFVTGLGCLIYWGRKKRRDRTPPSDSIAFP